MNWVQTIFEEIFGLFVDDGRFTLAILLWLAIVWLAFPRIAVLQHWSGPGMFVGLALILMESSLRCARKHRNPR